MKFESKFETDISDNSGGFFAPRVDKNGKLLINLWLDDERLPPPGWVWVKSVDEAIAYLNLGVVNHMSLDHDLGVESEGDPLVIKEAKTGYDLTKWMAENQTWSREAPTVHSANPAGAANMKSVINRYGDVRWWK